MQNILVRADSSHIIGIGHIMRCLTLLKALQRVKSFTAIFVCRPFSGNAGAAIRQSGFYVHWLSTAETEPQLENYASWLGATKDQDADETSAIIHRSYPFLLITDHYGIDSDWYNKLDYAGQVLAIDDLANRYHQADFLLDQTLGRQPESYRTLVPDDCQILTGTQFALLREEFQSLSDPIPNRISASSPRKKLLVMLGGTDPENLTLQVLLLICPTEFPDVTVVLGPTSSHHQVVSEYCEKNNWEFIPGTNDVPSLMWSHDISVGSSGTTSWERCCCALPSITIQQAENQLSISQSLENAGAARILKKLDKEALSSALKDWVWSDEAYHGAALACREVCDGQGANRVINEIVNNVKK